MRQSEVAGVKYSRQGAEKENPAAAAAAAGRTRSHLEEIWPTVGSKQRDFVMDAATQTGKADGWTNKMLKGFLF